MKHAKLFIVIVVIALIAGFFVFSRYRSAHTSTVSYKSEKVERTTIATTILATGSVKPVTRVDIKSQTAGRAEKVLVNEGDHVHKNQVLVLTSSTERAALLDSAREHGPEEYKKWEELERPIPILAPIDGEIILRSIEPGQTFSTTDAILGMSDRLMVEALVDETDIAQVKKGQEASIVLDAYPDNPFTGKVYKIAYDATTTNNVTTYHVDLLPDKVPDFMRSGMTANVTFEILKKENILAIPTEALKKNQGRDVVLTAGPDGEAPVMTEVQTGLSDGKHTEIMSGLSEGDTVLMVQANTTATTQGTNPFMPGRMGQKKSSSGGRPPPGH